MDNSKHQLIKALMAKNRHLWIADKRAVLTLLETGEEITKAFTAYKSAQTAWERVGVCTSSCIEAAKASLKKADNRWNDAVTADRAANCDLMRTSLAVIQATEAVQAAKNQGK